MRLNPEQILWNQTKLSLYTPRLKPEEERATHSRIGREVAWLQKSPDNQWGKWVQNDATRKYSLLIIQYETLGKLNQFMHLETIQLVSSLSTTTQWPAIWGFGRHEWPLQAMLGQRPTTKAWLQCRAPSMPSNQADLKTSPLLNYQRATALLDQN